MQRRASPYTCKVVRRERPEKTSPGRLVRSLFSKHRYCRLERPEKSFAGMLLSLQPSMCNSLRLERPEKVSSGRLVNPLPSKCMYCRLERPAKAPDDIGTVPNPCQYPSIRYVESASSTRHSAGCLSQSEAGGEHQQHTEQAWHLCSRPRPRPRDLHLRVHLNQPSLSFKGFALHTSGLAYH
eukprot:749463-Hanusia_phi.AAC.1